MNKETRLLVAAPPGGSYSQVAFSYRVDPLVSTDAFVGVAYIQARADTQASAMVHKWLDRFHRPDKYNPYPEWEAMSATVIDRGDFLVAWQEALARYSESIIELLVGRGLPDQSKDEPPFCFIIYDKGKKPNQTNGRYNRKRR